MKQDHHLFSRPLLYRLDYSGITFLIVGSFVPWLYFGFYCEDVARAVYSTFIVVLGIVCLIVAMKDTFGSPKYRPFRAGKSSLKRNTGNEYTSYCTLVQCSSCRRCCPSWNLKCLLPSLHFVKPCPSVPFSPVLFPSLHCSVLSLPLSPSLPLFPLLFTSSPLPPLSPLLPLLCPFSPSFHFILFTPPSSSLPILSPWPSNILPFSPLPPFSLSPVILVIPSPLYFYYSIVCVSGVECGHTSHSLHD